MQFQLPPQPRLQSMAVFDKISSAEKAQILGAGAQNSCQVQIMSELRGSKVTKYVLKTIKIRKNLAGTVDILYSLVPNLPNMCMPRVK